MTRRSRSLPAVAVALAAALVLGACGGGSGHSGGGSGDELRIAMPLGDVASLDPAHTLSDAMAVLLPLYGQTLVEADAKQPTKILPGLASSWTKDSPTRYTFVLRDGVKFSSGNTMTAEDVQFSFDRIKNVAGPTAFKADGIKTITAVDPHTVRFDLDAPDSTFIAKLATPYLAVLDSKTLASNGGVADATASKADKAQAFLDAHSVGTGPYVLDKWSRNQQISLKANPTYWGEKPKFKKVVLVDVRDAATQRQLLEGGDVDVAMSIDPDTADSLKGASGITITRTPAYNVIYLAMNNAHPDAPELGNVLVRRAIQRAIDYDGISKLAGGADRPAAAVPLGFQGSAAVPPVQRNVAEAKALLAKAGVKHLSLDITFANQVLYGVSLSTLWEKLKSDLAEVGITLTLKPVEYENWVGAFRAAKLTMTTGLWAPDHIDAGGHFDVFARTDGTVGKRVHLNLGDNGRGYASYLAAPNDAAKERIATQLITTMRDDASLFALVQPKVILAFSDRLSGVEFHPIKQLDVAAISPK
ncbi:MAG TPA: ABC transporter substrate-binding protein [Mycobacteriales bacterium]